MQIDHKLINGCRRNNREAQKQMYLLLLPYLRAVANRYLRNTSYVKDVLQESFMKIFEKLNEYDSQKASIKNWAARIVINKSINYNNRIIKESTTEIDEKQRPVICFPSVLADQSEQHLLYLLKQMPENYFIVFNLYVIEEYRHEEIAKFLNISESLSRKRLSRARAWIKKTFQDKKNLRDEHFLFCH